MKNHQILDSEPKILTLSTLNEVNVKLDGMDPFSCPLADLEEAKFHAGEDLEIGFLEGVLMCRQQLAACGLEVTK